MSTLQALTANNAGAQAASAFLMFNTPAHRGKICIMVEGKDDEALYGKFFSDSKTFFLQMNGCSRFHETIRILNARYAHRLVAIKDADFDTLNGVAPAYGNMFLTDAHDHEMMIMLPKSIDGISVEYLGKAESGLLAEAQTAVRNLSFVKWYNCVNSCRLVFDHISVDATHDKSLSECLSYIHAHADNAGRAPVQPHDLAEFVLVRRNAPYAQLLNGHDVCAALSIKIKARKPQNIKKNAIPNKLRDLYTDADFQQTSLYVSLRRWFDGSSVPQAMTC